MCLEGLLSRLLSPGEAEGRADGSLPTRLREKQGSHTLPPHSLLLLQPESRGLSCFTFPPLLSSAPGAARRGAEPLPWSKRGARGGLMGLFTLTAKLAARGAARGAAWGVRGG